MKVELNLEEINEAIALYLRELSGYSVFEITDIKHSNDDEGVEITTAVISNIKTSKPSPCVPAAPRAY